MSRTDRDQRGGHRYPSPQRQRRKLTGIYDCGCCERIPPPINDPNRTARTREAYRRESRANG